MTTHPNTRATAEKFNKITECYCDACGGTYKFRRGDAVVCPYCSNAPDKIILTGALFHLDGKESLRWQ